MKPGSAMAAARCAADDEIVEAQIRWIAKLAAANGWPLIRVAAGMAIWAEALEHRAASTRELLERVEAAGGPEPFFGPLQQAADVQVGRRIDELVALYRVGEMGDDPTS